MTSFIRLPKPLEIGLTVIAVAAGLFALFHIVTTPEPQLPLDVANGTYVSSDGEALILRDGKLSAGNGSIRYIIETDKQGSYVLPDGRLREEGDGTVRVDQRQGLMKSYLDNPVRPSKISFWVWRSSVGDGPDLEVFDRQPEPESGVR